MGCSGPWGRGGEGKAVVGEGEGEAAAAVLARLLAANGDDHARLEASHCRPFHPTSSSLMDT
jgi:hypothetical protein